MAPVYPVYLKDMDGNDVLDAAGNRQYEYGSVEDNGYANRVTAQGSKKDDVLPTAIKGRYVKLVVPRTCDSMNAFTSRVFAFDVYGTKSTSSIDTSLAGNDGIAIYSTSVPANGSLTVTNAEEATARLYSLA